MAVAGLFLIGYGLVKAYVEPAGTYSNYWGGQMFAPFVIVVGVIALAGALFRRTEYPSPARPGEKEVEFPHESIDRPWNG